MRGHAEAQRAVAIAVTSATSAISVTSVISVISRPRGRPQLPFEEERGVAEQRVRGVEQPGLARVLEGRPQRERGPRAWLG